MSGPLYWALYTVFAGFMFVFVVLAMLAIIWLTDDLPAPWEETP